MRLAILKRSGAAGVASVVLTSALAVGLAQNASAKANPPDEEARTLEGSWWVEVTALTDCVSHVPLMSFTALLTFAKGGTMTGTTTNSAFATGQRSPDHGVWFRNRAAHAYRASSVALLLFGTAPNFPATPGFQAGSHRLSQAIDVTDPDHFTSDAVSEFLRCQRQQIPRRLCDRCGAAVRIGLESVASRQFENRQFILEWCQE